MAHLRQDPGLTASHICRGRVHTKVGRVRQNGSEQSGLPGIDAGCRNAEIATAGRLGAVEVRAELREVQVDLEDARLGQQ